MEIGKKELIRKNLGGPKTVAIDVSLVSAGIIVGRMRLDTERIRDASKRAITDNSDSNNTSYLETENPWLRESKWKVVEKTSDDEIKLSLVERQMKIIDKMELEIRELRALARLMDR